MSVAETLLSIAGTLGFDVELISRYGAMALLGLKTTLKLVAISVPLGFLLALGLAYARTESGAAARALASAFMSFFRGTPVICQLFLVYYGAGQFHAALQSAGLWWIFRDAFWCAVLTFSLNTAAYQAEILRGAVANLHAGQREAAEALGFGRFAAWALVLLPQALLRSIRPLGNEVILIIKASSVVSVVTLVDVMGAARKAFNGSLDFEVYLWAAVVYLTAVEIVRRTSTAIERRATRRLGAI